MHCNKKKCEEKAYQYQSVQRFTEVVAQRCSVKKVFLEILQNLQENTCARASLLIKLQAFGTGETLAQVFSCEFCKISKNTFFYRTLLVAASGFIREYSYVKHIPYFAFLQLSQKTQFQNVLTYQKPLSTKHFCNIFPIKVNRFHRLYFFD